MVTGQREGVPPGVVATGWKPGKKKGWIGLTKGHVVAYRPSADKDLSIATIIYNDKNAQQVTAQCHRSLWNGMAVVHRAEFFGKHMKKERMSA